MDDFKISAQGFGEQYQADDMNSDENYYRGYNNLNKPLKTDQITDIINDARNAYNETTEVYNTIKKDLISVDNKKINRAQYMKWTIIPSLLVVAYYLFPIDIIPDSLPVIGTLDDFAISQGILLTGLKVAIRKNTGVSAAINDLVNKRMLIANVVEHIVTSTLQMLTLVVGDIMLLPTICSCIDCIVTLTCIHIVVYKYWPILVNEVESYRNINQYNNNNEHYTNY